MKRILLLSAIAALSTQAHAVSWFQTNCSDGSAKVRHMEGHDDNKLVITVSEIINNQLVFKSVELDPNLYTVNEASSTELSKYSHNTCKPGDLGGVVSWRNIIAKQILITNTAGELFPEGTYGVSEDRKTVGAYVICDQQGNSLIPCNEK